MKCYCFSIRAVPTEGNRDAGGAHYATAVVWALAESQDAARSKANAFLSQRHWLPEEELSALETTVRQHPGNKTSVRAGASYSSKLHQQRLLHQMRREGVSGEIYLVQSADTRAKSRRPT